jgi:hypothetical protein
MPRSIITAAKLYAILDREFRKRRMTECESCRVPLPFYRDPPDDVSANWAIGTPSECPRKCHVIIAEVLAELWPKYDIKRSETADAE